MLQRKNLKVGRRWQFCCADHLDEEAASVFRFEAEILVTLANERMQLPSPAKLISNGLGHHVGSETRGCGGNAGKCTHYPIVTNDLRAVNHRFLAFDRRKCRLRRVLFNIIRQK